MCCYGKIISPDNNSKKKEQLTTETTTELITEANIRELNDEQLDCFKNALAKIELNFDDVKDLSYYNSDDEWCYYSFSANDNNYILKADRIDNNRIIILQRIDDNSNGAKVVYNSDYPDKNYLEEYQTTEEKFSNSLINATYPDLTIEIDNKYKEEFVDICKKCNIDYKQLKAPFFSFDFKEETNEGYIYHFYLEEEEKTHHFDLYVDKTEINKLNYKITGDKIITLYDKNGVVLSFEDYKENIIRVFYLRQGDHFNEDIQEFYKNDDHLYKISAGRYRFTNIQNSSALGGKVGKIKDDKISKLYNPDVDYVNWSGEMFSGNYIELTIEEDESIYITENLYLKIEQLE